ncbi:MAG: hypothetical protein AB1761_00685 [Pseudomonadota bacterium]
MLSAVDEHLSERLREDPAPAFYGDVDFIPTREYGPAVGQAAIDEARAVLEVARKVVV